MRLFRKEQIPLILAWFLQLFLILLVLGLIGSPPGTILFYLSLLSISVLTVYLVYRYLSHHQFYERLSRPVKELEESIRETGDAPLPEALDGLLQSQYRLYREKLYQYERGKRDHVTFIHQWVHQMKTPLSVMDLMLQEEEDPRFDPVRDELDKLGKGLETVLYNARLEMFDRDFQVQPVHLDTIVARVIRQHKRLFIRNRVYPEVKVDPAFRVESDEKWLIFAVGQLVTNAVRYSAGTGSKVTFSAFTRGQQGVLEVRDEGVGIPAQDLPRVFDPYFTGENGRDFTDSTGMGLYLVRQVCDKLGHWLELESQKGEGTAVRLVFSSLLPRLTPK